MIVVAVRHQHDVDLGQRVERNAGIVVPFRSGKRKRRGAHRPHGIDQEVHAGGLDQPARMSDKGQPYLVSGDPRRRRVGMGARHPIGPGRAPPARTELPAQQLQKRFRWRTVGIEKMLAVEMIRYRSGIGFHAGNPNGRHADGRDGAGKQSKKAAAGDFHAPIGLKTPVSARGVEFTEMPLLRKFP